MTPAQITLWLALAGPPPDAYFVPGCAWSYEATVSYYADAMMVPRSLSMKVLHVESTDGLDLEAWRKVIDPEHPKKKKWKLIAEGAFMVAKDYEKGHVEDAGMTLDEYDPKDFRDSARVGLAFLAKMFWLFDGNRRAAIAGYNAGPVPAARWFYEGWALPAETREYFRKVFHE